MKHRTILIALMLLAALLAGCQEATAFLPVEQTLPVTAAPDPDIEAMKKLILAANAAIANRPVTYKSTTVLDSGETHQTVYDSFPPDRIHVFNDGTEFIVIGDVVYMKENSGAEWQIVNMDPNNFRNTESQTQLENSIGNISYLGEEILNERSMKVYQYTTTLIQNGISLDSTNKVWIDPVDGFIHQLLSDGDIVKMDSSSGEYSTAHAVATIEFIYSADLKIEPPIQ